MKFEEILPKLKTGEKVYRDKYFRPPFDFNKHIIYFDNNEVIRQYYDGTLPCRSYLEYEDLVADDWKIYEEEYDTDRFKLSGNHFIPVLPTEDVEG